MQLNPQRKYVMKEKYSIVLKLEINYQKLIQASATEELRRRFEMIVW